MGGTIVFSISFTMGNGKSKYYGASEPNLSGKTIVVTGASTGIGQATATSYLLKKASVVVLARNPSKTEKAIEEMKTAVKSVNPDPKISFVKFDMNDLTGIKNTVGELEKIATNGIDILVNNAGMGTTAFHKSAQGFEQSMAVNHLAPFSLTLQIIEKGMMNEGSRIVVLSSMAHDSSQCNINWEWFANPDESRFGGFMSRISVYGDSKWANILFASELNRRWRGGTVYSVHPGVVNTEFTRNSGILIKGLARFTGKTPQDGAEPTLWTSLHPGIEDLAGSYFTHESISKGKPQKMAPKFEAALDSEGLKMWEWSLEATKVKDPTA